MAPSGSYQWGPGGCPASAAMQQRFPELEESEAAKEGTAAHWYASETVVGRQPAVPCIAPNGVLVTEQMAEDCAAYIAECQAAIATGNPCYVEQHVVMHRTVHPLNDGTPDFFMVDYQQRRVKLLDFKYGHRYVDAFRNKQLGNYLLGIFETLQLDMTLHGWTWEAVIHQPRNWHPEGHRRVWTPDGERLTLFMADMRKAAQDATDPNALCVTGDHCLDCTAAHACTLFQQVCADLIDRSGAAQPHVLTPDAVGRELTTVERALKRLTTRRDNLKEQATTMAAQGQRVTGWQGDYSHSKDAWGVPVAKVIAVGAAMGVDLATPPKAKTPVQARAAHVPDSVVAAMLAPPKTVYTLVPVTQHSIAKGLSTNG